MIIDVPDGMDILKIKLTEVLYSPKVEYTLISVGRLDEAGFSATFGQEQCKICSSDGEWVETIPKSVKGLYRVIHESAKPESGDSANAATMHLTAMEFHRHMGHVSPAVAKHLVTYSFVTGVSLDTSSDKPTFCKSCIYAKSHHQAFPKVREGKWATTFGAEIHSNIWGPSPVETISGCCYFILFMDDYS